MKLGDIYTIFIILPFAVASWFQLRSASSNPRRGVRLAHSPKRLAWSMTAGLAYVAIAFFVIPPVLSIELRQPYLLVSQGTILLWMYWYHRRWRAITAAASSEEMATLGKHGERLVMLAEPRLRDVVRPVVLLIPWSLLAAQAFVIVLSVGLPAPEDRPQGGSIAIMLWAFSCLAIALFHWLMVRTLKKPQDLRSADPQRYQAEIKALTTWKLHFQVLGQTLLVIAQSGLLWTLLQLPGNTQLIVFGCMAPMILLLLGNIALTIKTSRIERRRWQPAN